VIAAATGVGTILVRGRLSRRQVLSAANFVALLAHQYEEYEYRGYFPGQFNRGLFKSESGRNYPLNPQTAMIVNTALAYPFYLAPLVVKKPAWFGLAPVIVGWAQVVLHGVVLPRRSGARYGPGFVTALLLHLPVGVAYVKTLNRQRAISSADWGKAFGGAVASAVFGVAIPVVVLRDAASPYAFTDAQMGPYLNPG
jgi:hypothetical protein